MSDGEFWYRRTSYDFDEALAARVGASRKGRLALAVGVLRRRPEVLELNEPMALVCWPTLLLVHLAVLARNLALPGRTRVVTYALENMDTVDALVDATPLPRPVASALVRVGASLQVRAMSRIAFGIDQAADNYRAVAPRALRSIESTTIEGLSMPCPTCEMTGQKQPGRVVFVGSFDDRKGVLPLLDAWPQVTTAGASLTVMGKDRADSDEPKREGEVRERVAAIDGAELVVDPPRQLIHETLSSARVVVLLSRTFPRWREQIGLPILEGLSHGCVIVATDQTGIAGWLRENGHQVVSSTTPQEVAAAIDGALASPLSPEQILATLPSEDSRLTADRWLLEAGRWAAQTDH